MTTILILVGFYGMIGAFLDLKADGFFCKESIPGVVVSFKEGVVVVVTILGAMAIISGVAWLLGLAISSVTALL